MPSQNHILLASSSGAIRKLLRRILSTYTIHEAQHAAECMAVLRTHRIDAVLLDVQILDQNPAFIKDAHPHLQQTSILVVCEPARSEFALASGAHEIATYPIQPPVVLNRLKRLLKSRNTASFDPVSLVKTYTVAASIRDLNGRILAVNKAFIDLFGYASTEAVAGKQLAEIYPEERAQEKLKRDAFTVADGKPRFEEQHTEHGKQVVLSEVPIHNGQEPLILCFAHQTPPLKAIQRAPYVLWHATTNSEHITFLNEDAVRQLLSITDDQSVLEAWKARREQSPDAERLQKTLQDAHEKKNTHYRVEYRVRNTEGSLLWLADEVSLEADTHRLTGITLDITRQKATEAVGRETRETLISRLDSHTMELARTNETLREQQTLAETLRDTAAALSSSLDLDEVLDLVLLQLRRIMPPYDAASVVFVENGTLKIARAIAYPDADGEQRHTLKDFSHKLEDLPNYVKMRKTHKPIVIADTRQTEDWVVIPETSWIRSYCGAPIVAADHVIGFISLDSATPNRFTETLGSHLQSFAYQAGVAIRNAQLYASLQNVASNLEAGMRARTKEVEVEKAQLQAIMDSIGEGVIYYGEDGEPVYINRALTGLTGYDEKTLLSGKINILDPVVSSDDAEDPINKKLRLEGHWSREVKIRRGDGSKLDAQLIMTRVEMSDGNEKGTVTVIRDISQEKELRDRQARFVSYASHELRTPITNLKTRLYLIQRQPDRRAEHMAVIIEVVERMERLVESLLQSSKLERGSVALKRERVTLQDLLRYVHRLQTEEARRKEIHMALQLPDTPLIVNLDRERVIQVITNLVTNALNHTAAGGSVTMKLEMEFTRRNGNGQRAFVSDTGNIYSTERWALISIQDTGSGIAAEHIPHLFQPFYRVDSSQQGTGLGLTIAYEIATQHGGRITVESDVGKGSTFKVWLPMEHITEEADI